MQPLNSTQQTQNGNSADKKEKEPFKDQTSSYQNRTFQHIQRDQNINLNEIIAALEQLVDAYDNFITRPQ
jgi:hypothetical protein